MRAWPFTGRDAEVDAVGRALEHGSVALVGPPGIGKTRLATEMLARLRERSVVTAQVGASPSVRGVPLLALRPLLGDDGAGHLVGAIHQALGLGAHRPGPGDPVLLVDDAHALDDQSAAVLAQLLAAGRTRLVLTLRDTEALTGPVAALLRHDAVARVPLGRLDDRTVEALLGAALGGPVDGRTLVQLTASSRGNAMLLRELVVGAEEAGALVERSGLWTLIGPPRSTPVLRELVSSRLASISSDEQTALELVVVGGALPLSLLGGAVPLDAVEGLERRGVVSVTDGPGRHPTSRADGPTVDVAHPLYRDVLLDDLGPLARRRCNARLAELAEHADAGRADAAVRPAAPSALLQRCVWRLLGGEPMNAEDALAAARYAASLNDTPLAGDLALASFDAGPTAEAAILASWCLATNGRQQEAETFAAMAQRSCTEPSGIAALALRRAEERWWWAHDGDGAREILRDTASSLPGAWADLLRVQPAVFDALDGRAAAAVAGAEPFLEHGLIWVRRIAAIAAGFGYVLADRTADAEAVSDRAFAEGQHDPFLELSGDPAIHVACRVFAGTYGADLVATEELARMVYDAAIQQHARQSRAWGAMLHAMALLARGRPRSAARRGLEGELLWADSQISGMARWCATVVAAAHLELGELASAEEALGRALAYDGRGFAYSRPFETRVGARLAAARGDRAGAIRDVVDAGRSALRLGTTASAADCVDELVRLGDAGAAVQLAASIPRPHGPLTALRVRLARGVVDQDGAALADVAQELERMGRDLAAAEAGGFAAAAHRRAGRPKDAARAMAAAVTVLDRCEGAVPSTMAEPASAHRLSPRELEIASLAAAGATNRMIADQLVVSERTVESHLYRVYVKLGVGAREELAAQLRAMGRS